MVGKVKIVHAGGYDPNKPMTPNAMGSKGGKARAANSTCAQRSALARMAAKARWAKAKKGWDRK
jgi:hypothetical protein